MLAICILVRSVQMPVWAKNVVYAVGFILLVCVLLDVLEVTHLFIRRSMTGRG